MRFTWSVLLLALVLVACRGDGPQRLSDSPQPEAYQLVGQRFPTLAGEALSGDSLVFPDAVAGKVAVISIAFVQESQAKIDAWIKPLEDSLAALPGVVYYEIPLMRTYNALVRGIAARGMRSGIPEGKHSNVVCYHGPQEAYFTAFQTRTTAEAYTLVLDRTGTVRFMAEGLPTPATKAAFTQTLARLLEADAE